MTTRNKDSHIFEEGDLKKYRTEKPNLIYDLRLTPFEYTLYGYLKKTAGAGPGGKCFKSAETLAAETGMSEGMISRAKKGLLRTDRPGLRGKALIRLEKDTSHAGRPRDIITITDIWPENFRHYDALYGDHDEDLSGSQSSPYEDQRSPGDLQRSPQRSPGDPKNRKESKKESGEEEREETAPAPSSSNSLSASSAAASQSGRHCAALLPPSLDDVRCRLREIGQSESHAEKFHAYYDERGWTKGRDNRPVGDWRKALTTWLVREPEFQSRAPASPARSGAPTRATAPPGQKGLTLEQRSQNTLDALTNAGL